MLPRMSTMTGVYLPGNSDVDIREVPVPQPGPRQVLVRMRASTICGSDLRAIYHEHTGSGAERYNGVIGGHEPCGEIVEVGSDVRQFGVGDRVVIYHIAGCGLCEDCREGYMITCQASIPTRASYGWQRDGGHADYLLAEESTCIALPEPLSFLDGACVACGFGTAYEALCRIAVSGRDTLLITGLGPVGMAAGLLAKGMGVSRVIGTDTSPDRVRLATEAGSIDDGLLSRDGIGDEIAELTHGRGCEASIDCSGAPPARLLALKSTRQWGRCALVGEGNNLDVDVSKVLIHKQLTVFGSWVTSLPRMERLLEHLVRWDLRPERIVTHRFPLAETGEAYRVADSGVGGKIAVVMDA